MISITEPCYPSNKIKRQVKLPTLKFKSIEQEVTHESELKEKNKNVDKEKKVRLTEGCRELFSQLKEVTSARNKRHQTMGVNESVRNYKKIHRPDQFGRKKTIEFYDPQKSSRFICVTNNDKEGLSISKIANSLNEISNDSYIQPSSIYKSKSYNLKNDEKNKHKKNYLFESGEEEKETIFYTNSSNNLNLSDNNHEDSLRKENEEEEEKQETGNETRRKSFMKHYIMLKKHPKLRKNSPRESPFKGTLRGWTKYGVNSFISKEENENEEYFSERVS